MRSNQFVKFKNINLSLFKTLKNIEKKKSFFHHKEIPELKKFMLECKTMLDTKKDTRALIICLYPKIIIFQNFLPML